MVTPQATPDPPYKEVPWEVGQVRLIFDLSKLIFDLPAMIFGLSEMILDLPNLIFDLPSPKPLSSPDHPPPRRRLLVLDPFPRHALPPAQPQAVHTQGEKGTRRGAFEFPPKLI